MAAIDQLESNERSGYGRYCSNCGAFADDARFCPQCGLALGDLDVHQPGARGNPPHVGSGGAAGSAPRGSRAVVLTVAGVLGLIAVAVAAIILANGSGKASGGPANSSGGSDAAYRAKLQSALNPLVSANQALSSALNAMDGSRHTIAAAQNTTSAAESAVTSARGAINVLNAPAGDSTLAQQVQQALTDEAGYLQGISSTLQTPVGNSAATLQPLATSAQSALVPLSAVSPGLQNSLGGTSNLIAWSNGAADAAHRQQQNQGGASGAAGNSSASSSASSSNPYAGMRACGGDLYAGPNTTCPFAANVQAAYNQAPGTVATVQVYSPVTGQTYSMSCSPAGAGVTCSGGNDASVSWG